MPTVTEILELPEMVRGQPRVFAGSENLDSEVRWVHITEHHDIARLMYGRELVLTTGVAWPSGIRTGVQFVKDLASAGASAVVIELVRQFTTMPPDMIKAAEAARIPLIGLEREVRFIDITYAVHTMIIDEQFTELKVINEAHRAFTTLEQAGATPEAVLGEVSRITSRPAVLETLSHQVTAFSAGDVSASHLLSQWEPRSRRADGNGEGPGSQWLTTTVEARGQRFGRLVLVADDPLPAWTRLILERAATALAVNRLIERDQATLEQHSHGSLLTAIMQASYSSPEWLDVRSEALGVPLRGKTLIGMVVIPNFGATGGRALGVQAARREYAERTAEALRSKGMTALVGPTPSNAVAIILAFDLRKAPADLVAQAAGAIHRSFAASSLPRCVIGVGTSVRGASNARRTLLEAGHAAESIHDSDDTRPFYRIEDVGVTGLAHLLRDDPRLQTYVERMLGELLVHDQTNNTDLEAVLRAFLKSGGNKSKAAESYGLSRPAFYGRLSHISDLLSMELDDVEVRTSLHVALLALDKIRAAAPQVLAD